MREFEPVECPHCKRHVDPEEYDEVDETCDACRADRDIRRHLYQVSTPDGTDHRFCDLVDIDPKDLPWGGSGE